MIYSNCGCENESLGCYKIITDKNCDFITIKDDSFDNNYVQVFILKFNNTLENNYTQTLVRENASEEIIFAHVLDGFYTILKLNIPIDESKPYYYKNKKYYHENKEVLLLEIVNINPEISQIQSEYIYYFSTCNLKKCFIKICQDILEHQTSICKKSNIDSSLIYKRDLLWSAINVIKYMVEIDQFEEAQRLLEEITGCNGLCSPQFNYNSCGCLK